jgi:glycosyltransferase involved in cell wall biosynthesis
VIGEEYRPRGLERDIDVLIQKRKSSAYLLDVLAPTLANKCRLKIMDEWVDDLSEYFNRTKVYLYDSTDHWLQKNATEGFGLPPLEAMACGCTVFSSINDALSDYLDPGFNCYKLRTYSTAFDRAGILSEVENFVAANPEPLIRDYRSPAVLERAQVVMAELNRFFDHLRDTPSDIPSAKGNKPEPMSLSRLKSSTRAALIGITRRFG